MGNILIVEDNVMNMEMAGELLEKAGHYTIRAENATEGINLARINKPDLILMDLNLDGMDGLTATKILKEDILTKNIPVIAFTAMVMQNDKEKAEAAGCSGFIEKPIDVAGFVNRIESFLNADVLSKKCVTQSLGVEEAASVLLNTSFIENTKKQISELKNKWHKVLIVDDNPMNAEILKEILEQIGQSSVVAYSGKAAFDLIEKEKFDLILLDIMMPEMSGFDVIKKLKSEPLTKDIPVIFISALDQTEDIVKGFKLGSYGYITKPFKIEELKARILSILKIKDLQDELRAEKALLDSIFQFSADGLVVLNSEFKVISCNELFLKWLDISKEQVINQDFCCVMGHSENFCDERTCFQDGINNWEFCLENNIDKAKDKKFLHINCSEIKTLSGECDGYILIMRDITGSKEIEQQKETFVATLTHDLKTPIRAQMRALEMLIAGKFGEVNGQQKEMIQETLNSNKYMFGMVDNLLATYKYENKSINLQKDSFDINDLIKNCQKDLQYLSNDKNQAIDFNFEEESLILCADQLEMKRVILNLLSNAINYTGESGKIVVSSKIVENRAEISFIDNGKGISEEEMSNLFNKYQSYAKRFRQIGTGLGLYLSKHIVENHDGEITVNSEEGKGSVFTVKLPLN